MERGIKNIITEADLFTLAEGQKITSVLFGAVWNQGTRAMEDRLEVVLQSHDDYAIGYCNVEESQELAIKYGIKEFPTLVFFSPKGELISGYAGVLSSSAIENKFSEALMSSVQK